MTLLWLGIPDLITASLERVIQAERKERIRNSGNQEIESRKLKRLISQKN